MVRLVLVAVLCGGCVSAVCVISPAETPRPTAETPAAPASDLERARQACMASGGTWVETATRAQCAPQERT